ncbi:hypothetical protein [Herbiconiux sp. YIM B11900]|uniref:hypothetical protein n=1 Tax=Herbiconiux sp. YIM B11900 TaxID=3404131 RepID=UPI003F834FC7
MNENTWAAPGSEPQAPDAAPPAAAPPAGHYEQYPPPVPQYGQYAPPPAPPQPQPQYGQYAPPPAPAYAPPGHGQPHPGYGPQPGAYGPGWQSSAQWAPPPKPGLIPLRPLGFGTLMAAPFQVLRRNPKATFGSGLLVQLIVVVVTAVFVGVATFWALSRWASLPASSDEADAISAGNVAVLIVSIVIPLALSLFASALLQAVLVVEVARATLGEKRRLGELWKVALRRTLPLAGWFFLVAAAVLVGLAIIVGIVVLGAFAGGPGLAIAIVVAVLLSLGLGVLSAWIGTKLSMVPSVIVLERLGVGAAIRRSWRLTAGMANFWRTLGVIWLVAVILSFATQLISTPFSFLMPIVATVIDPNNSGSGIAAIIVLYLVFVVVTIVLGAISAVVQAATVAVIYIDLRMRKEGLGIELTRFVESRQSGLDEWPDPYLPQPRG